MLTENPFLAPKRTSDVFNPATGEVSAKVNLATKKDVDDAVEIAKTEISALQNQP